MLLAPDGPHVDPMNLAIGDGKATLEPAIGTISAKQQQRNRIRVFLGGWNPMRTFLFSCTILIQTYHSALNYDKLCFGYVRCTSANMGVCHYWYKHFDIFLYQDFNRSPPAR